MSAALAQARPVGRSLLADQVMDQLLERILSGEYLPDSRIVETQVARELNTSQAPVREALRALAALGIVETTPFKGARVRRPARREILEAYAVRSALESLAVRLAVPRLTRADVAELAGYCDAMQTAASAGDPHGVAEWDARFHGRILEIADNGTLQGVWRSLEPFLRTYITMVVPGADPQWAADLHRPILAALRAGDSDGALSALEDHFQAAGSNLAERWPDEATALSPVAGDGPPDSDDGPPRTASMGHRAGDER